MDIRPLARMDLAALLHLYRDLHRSDEPLPAPEVVERAWTDVVAGDRCTCLGGFVGDDLVASCTVAVIPNLTRGCRPYGVIENVVTGASHRKRGYGSAMLRAALAYAWSAGCYKVMLMTGRRDEETLRFYRAAGFEANEKQGFVARPSA